MDLSRYHAVLERVNTATTAAGRRVDSVTIVAVSKGQPIADIQSLYDAGQRDFGENRAHEMADKAEVLPKDIHWHFVGSLQSNKVRYVRQSTFLLHSLDRKSLVAAWIKGIGTPPPALIQVNVGSESQKGGVEPQDVGVLAGIATDMGIAVVGLMTIPPVGRRPEDSRPYFAMLRGLRDRVGATDERVCELSMGMTDDFEIGIAEGASFIRVGRAIFGPRR